MEWRLIDITTRMFTEPVFDGDAPLFDALARKEIDRTDELLRSLKTDAKALGSNDAFAALLEQLGVEPPRKTSPTTGKEVYAFAKTDAGMQELLEGADPDVALLAEARLRVKSTNVVTRSQRMADIARRGKIPIPLNYWGAMVTGRHSGGGKMNALNLHVKSGIRSGFRAPPGCVVISGDSAQIELRSTLFLSREDAPLEILRAGGDLYKDTAAKLFSVPITSCAQSATRRFTIAEPRISAEKNPMVFPSLSAAVAMLSAIEVFPVPGRAPMMMSSWR
jgi:hypothetical protein